MTKATHAAGQNEQHIDEQVMDTLRRLGIEQAIRGTPVYKMAEILALKPIEELEEIAETLLDDPCPTERDELIARLHEALTDLETVKEQLLSLDVVCWQFFRQILENTERQDEKETLLYLVFPRQSLLMQAFYDEEQLIVIVPDEIKAAYESLLAGDLLAKRDLMELVDQYATASVQLYGVISIAGLTSLFNSHHRHKVSEVDVLEILDTCGEMTNEYLIADDFIAHPCFEDVDNEDIKGLMERADRYPRYIPRKSEFARYAETGYVPSTPQLTTLKRFLAETLTPELKTEAEELAEHAAVKFSTDWGYLETVAELLTETPWLKDIEVGVKRQTFLRLTQDLFENTRSWGLSGNTRKEAREMGLLDDFEDQDGAKAESAPVGRNALCPCGSGKKYKKCCGRDA